MLLGGGVVAGCLLGLWITAYPYSGLMIAVDEDLALTIDGYPPVILSGRSTGAIGAVVAGIVVGIIAATAVRSRAASAALAAGALATAACVVTIVLWQWQRGRWAAGSIDGRMIVVAGAVLVLVCQAGVLAATATAFHRRARSGDR